MAHGDTSGRSRLRFRLLVVLTVAVGVAAAGALWRERSAANARAQSLSASEQTMFDQQITRPLGGLCDPAAGVAAAQVDLAMRDLDELMARHPRLRLDSQDGTAPTTWDSLLPGLARGALPCRPDVAAALLDRWQQPQRARQDSPWPASPDRAD